MEDRKLLLRILKKAFVFFEISGFCFKVSWRASKLLAFVRILLEAMTAILPFLSIYMSKLVIDLLAGIYSKKGDETILYNFLLVLIWLLCIHVSSRVLDKIKETVTGFHNDYIVNDINIQIAEKTSTLEMSYFDSPSYYNELTNARRDTYSIQSLIWNIIQGVSTTVTLLVSFVMILNFNWIFAFVMVVTVIPSFIVERKYTEKVFNWQKNNVPEERKMQYLLSILTGRGFSKEIRLYNIGQDIINKYKDIWARWFSGKRKLISKKTIYICLLTAIPEICFICMVLFIGISIIKGKLTIGDYYLYTGMVGQLMGGLFSFVILFSKVFDNNLRVSRFKNFLKWDNEVKACGSKGINSINEIEFRNVSFKYPGTTNNILDKVSFKIYDKEKVALVGVNGAGKSTIVKLLLRFYEPTEGSILINGFNIKEFNLDSYRKCFSILFQDYANYAFSIRENISMSDQNNKADDTKIKEASIRSGADKIVEKYGDGIDTYLSREFEENGEELSGGEWQKIALARTFFRDSDMVILDEPSSSLDPESEHHIFETFAELCKGKGAIFISHRLANVTMADRIIVLDGGELIENGKHSELIKQNGKYAYLFSLQADKYKEAI